MRSDLDNALDAKPWSFAGVVFGLEQIRDDEGRPLSERRAPSVVKDGVLIELRSCPYSDERLGQPMNMSALTQVKRHLEAVLEEVAQFRAMSPEGNPTWAEVFVAVIDQLAAPARYLLETRARRGPVPAQCAVGHKLAAGYFDVLRKLLLREALGDRRPVSVKNLLTFVKEQRALIGASEVCAGPPNLIARVSEVLVNGMPTDAVALPLERVSIARLLSLQVQVGIAWELFDLESERRFLFDEIGRAHLRPRNAFIERKLDERIDELSRGAGSIGVALPELPETLAPDALKRLETVLHEPRENGSYVRTRDVIGQLLSYSDGAVELTLPSADAVVAASFARYLVTFREFVRVQCTIEQELRTRLGFAVDASIKLHPTVLPKPKGLDWYEVVLGHSLRSEPVPSAPWTLGNHHRNASIV